MILYIHMVIVPQLYVFLHKSWNKSSTRFVTTMHNYLFSDFGYTYGKIRV